MTDDLADLFRRSSDELRCLGLTRFADCVDASADAPVAGLPRAAFDRIGLLLQEAAIEPTDWLIAASMASLFPTHQPPGNLPDVRSQNRYLLRNLALRNYRVRVARIEDLPALTQIGRAACRERVCQYV